MGSYKYKMYAPALSYGFKKLGHDVIEVDYEQYHIKGHSFIASLLNKVQDRFHYGLMMKRYNNDVFKIVNRERPDIAFFYRCYHIWPKTLKGIKSLTTIFSYNNDDPFCGMPSKRFFRYHIRCANYCDLIFVYRKKNIDDYSILGINNTQVLLPHYLEKDNYYENVPDTIDVAFIGHYENDGRDAYIKSLKDAGIPVVVYNGSYWDKSPMYEDLKSIIKPGVHSPEYNHTINKCKIALVFLSKLNSDTYTRRCFEIPATKTLMLSEYTEDLDQLFPADKCAVYFRNKEELVEKCKKLLENPSEIKRIAENGYYRLKEIGGSEVDRCKEIIEIYQRKQ